MGKTTNILDLNNRLSKVEKENVAQNSYTSLKNKPKINSVTLTGNKTLADIGAAGAADLGALTDLTTTDKSSCVGAINEVVNKLNLKAVYKEFTNLTLNNNREINLGQVSSFLPDGVSGNIILFEICSATTGSGSLRVEAGKYLATSNVWLIGNVANQTIPNVGIRALYYEN